jgi:hypothetical protein
MRPPPSVCSGVVGVEGQGVDTKLQQHLHQELLKIRVFFFWFGSVEKRLETVHWTGEVAGMSSVKLGGVSNLFWLYSSPPNSWWGVDYRKEFSGFSRSA